MSSAVWDLQQAVHDALSADAGLVALLGGPHVYDDVPRGTPFPYLSLAAFTARDWTAGDAPGTEITFVVHAWSRSAGHKEPHLLAEAARSVLHDRALPLADHHLVNLRHETSETRRERDGETYRVIARFRAVLEPTP
jgi:hypothetical protein